MDGTDIPGADKRPFPAIETTPMGSEMHTGAIRISCYLLLGQPVVGQEEEEEVSQVIPDRCHGAADCCTTAAGNSPEIVQETFQFRIPVINLPGNFTQSFLFVAQTCNHGRYRQNHLGPLLPVLPGYPLSRCAHLSPFNPSGGIEMARGSAQPVKKAPAANLSHVSQDWRPSLTVIHAG